MKARVSLGLAKLSLPQKIEKARQWAAMVGGNAIFVNPLPALAAITDGANAAEAAYNAAQSGGPALTAVMNDKEVELDSLLTRLGNYVEIIANGNETIILAAGMDVRGKGGRGAFKFEVTSGYHEGEAILQSPVTPRAGYVWQKSVDSLPAEAPAPANASTWEILGFTTVATITATSLKPGTLYWFRVAPVTSTGQGLWSDPISLRAQ